MENKIEYIDKSILTQEQRDEIEKIVFNGPDKKLKSALKYIGILFAILLLLRFIVVAVRINDFDTSTIIIFFGIIMVSMFCIPIFQLDTKPKDYVLIKGTVENKRWHRGTGHYVDIIIENKKYEMAILTDLYWVINLNEERIFAVSFKDKNNIYSGTLLFDVTDMLENREN